MFVATNSENEIVDTNNTFTLNKWCEVETPNGFKRASSIKVGDALIVDTDDIVYVNSIKEVEGGDLCYEVTDKNTICINV